VRDHRFGALQFGSIRRSTTRCSCSRITVCPSRCGGAAFHFVDDGIEAALERALEAADRSDVRGADGATTIQQYLPAGLTDDMHLAIVPARLGGDERLFDHVDGGPDGHECVEFVSSPTVTHARLSPTTR
jgi:dihydrofolate reductase